MAARPRDPRKTTGLIGWTCKGRNALSEPVLTVDDLVIPTGFRRFEISNLKFESQISNPCRLKANSASQTFSKPKRCFEAIRNDKHHHEVKSTQPSAKADGWICR